MKRSLLFLVLSLALLIMPVLTQAQAPAGMSVTCTDGTSFDNGVEVSVNQLRSGFNYTATAIGLNGFDPVLAVLDSSGNGLCDDDATAAANYTADLPTTGFVPPSGLSSQVTFSQNTGSAFADISLVVGGYGNASGEFILILEGMGVTPQDGAGDSFSVNITPGMVDSGIPLTVYMITRGQSNLDPYIYQADANLDAIADSKGTLIDCDDAGSSGLCQPGSVDLSNSSVTIDSGTLPGWQYDSMLTVPLDGLQLNNDMSQNYYNFVMTTSPQQQTQGQYLLVFDIGTTGSTSSSNNGGSSTSSGGQETQGGSQSTQNQQSSNSGAPSGMSVTCNDGTSFDNGVEVLISQMRSGYNYTATAVGLNGFDPVLAVLDSNGNGLCSDDTNGAGNYSADLPTTGFVAPSNLSSQVTFNQSSGSDFADISLVVGGYGNVSGEFILILEGMAATPADGAGDAFSVNITPGMVNSGVPLTVYMITRGQSNLDPYIYESDGALNALTDSRGNLIDCDDAGSSGLCQPGSVDLSNSTVTIGSGTLPGWQYDSMLSLGLGGLQLSGDASQNYLTFVMGTSPEQATQGQYLLVFHVGETD